MSKLGLLLALIFILSACQAGAPQAPCDDYDPVGPCATSHSHNYDGRQ